MNDRELDTLCDRFDAAWRQTGRPRLEDFLVDQTDSELFAELLRIDLCYRKQVQESPDPAEYLVRFPQFAAVVPACFRSRSEATPLPTETVSQFSTARPPAAAAPASAPSISGYQVMAEIARGGMGRVYAARDLKLDREVAIKILLPGADASRFITEARITAQLPHPGIPPVHELGKLHDGTPYLAMKRIQGCTLAELLKERSDPQHELSRFVQIFEQVAQAVGFAHHRGIIHRDLKPLNVMVGEFGEVQVMDWGLAKELTSPGDEPAKAVAASPSFAGQTTVGSVLGTPGYMAPEQARGEPSDARADVFALGSLLAAILTGKPAFSGTGREMIDKAAQADLAEVLARLVGSGADEELVSLARRSLSARPEDRPANAREVAAEVAAYRSGVEARLQQAETDRARAETSAAEQLKRRRVVQWAAGLVAAVLLVGIVGTGWGMVSARRANDLTTERLKQIELINNSVLDIFAEFDIRELNQSGVPVEAALAENLVEAGHKLDAKAIHDPLVLAALQDRLGVTLLGLGFQREAIEFLAQSRDTRLQQLGPNHPETLMSTDDLARGYLEAGRFDQGIPLLEDTLKRMQSHLKSDNPRILNAMNSLGMGYLEAGQLEPALPLLEETLERRKTQLGPDDPDTLISMANLALGYHSVGQVDKVLPLLQEAHTRMEAKLGRDHPATLNSLNSLAMGYRAVGQFDQAIPLLEDALQRKKAKLGPDHPETLVGMNNLALCYQDAWQSDKALPLIKETLQRKQLKLGHDHPDTLTSMNNLAVYYQDEGKLEEALHLYEQTLQLRRGKLGLDHPMTLMSLGNLASCYRALWQFDQALSLFEETVSLSTIKLGLDHPETLTHMKALGNTYCQAGKNVAAIEVYQTYVQALRTHFPDESADLAIALVETAQEHLQAEHYVTAEVVLREALAIRESREPDAWTTFNTSSMLGGALLGQKKFTDAEPLLLQGFEGMKAREETIPPEGASRIPEALTRLISLYTMLEQPEKAKKYQEIRSQYPGQ